MTENKPYKIKFTPYRDGPGSIMFRQIKGGNNQSSDGRYIFYIDEEVDDPDFWVIQGKGLKRAQTVKVAPQNTILLSTEPRSVLIYPQRYIRQFGLVASCQVKTKHPNLVLSPPALPWFVGYRKDIYGNYTYSINYDYLKNSKNPEKKKLISVITSSKAFTKGHLDRIRFVEKLKIHYGDQIDIFGRGFNDFEDKWDVLAQYKYHIAIENSSHPYYWTEKLSDCFLTETFPIYHGCTNLNEYFPEGSYQQINIFNFEETVATIDKIIAEDTYEKSLSELAEAKSLVLDKYNIFNHIASLCDTLDPSLPKKPVTIHRCRTLQNRHNFYNYVISRSFFKIEQKAKNMMHGGSILSPSNPNSEIIINTEYIGDEKLHKFLKNLTKIFPTEGVTLYDKRNVIKSFIVDESDSVLNDVIVKKYKRPNIVQCIAYSFFRPSKAKRAFYNARILRQRGIETPLELSFIERWKSVFLTDTYFISASDYAPPIKEKLNDLVDFDQVLAKDFARYAATLHHKGILHHDLNQTNVLYHPLENGHYSFSVIDINRMAIYQKKAEIPVKDCFDNLTRFTGRMDLFEFVMKHYIDERGWNKSLLQKAIKIKIKHDERRRRRKSFLRIFKFKKK